MSNPQRPTRPTFFSRAGRRAAYHLARAASREFEAYTDLFVSPFEARADWRSGLGGSVYLLYAFVRATYPKVVVEVGSARGKSTCAMALACRQNGVGTVHAIDPHTHNDWSDRGSEQGSYEHLTGRLRRYRLEPWSRVHRSSSVEAAATWAEPIDLLFIDGDHTYDGVRTDFEKFKPFLSPRALVAFHDSLWELHRDNPNYRDGIGVPRYLAELAQAGYRAVTFDTFPGLTVLHPEVGGFDLFPRPAAAAAPPVGNG